MQRHEVTAVREYLSLPVAAPRRRSSRRGLRLLTLLATLGAASLGAAAPAQAQPPYRQEVLPGLGGLDAGSTCDPAFADLDGDGDQDLVAGNRLFTTPTGPSTAWLTYFPNTGSSSAPAFAGIATNASPAATITASHQANPGLVNLDGDGDFDLALGSYELGMRYFVNTGGSAAPAFLATSAPPWLFGGTNYNRPTFADLDGDGDLDAVLGKKDGTLLYLRNTGNATAPALVGITGTASPLGAVNLGSNSAPTLGDLDGDGDSDLVVGTLDRALHFLRNTGGSSAPAFTGVTGAANPLNGFTLGNAPRALDLDDDGDLDVVAGDFGGDFRYLLNTGSTSAPAFVAATGTANPFSGFERDVFSKPAVADLDGDGRLDVVVGGFDGTLSYLTNTGTARNPVFEQVTGSANPFGGIDVGYRCAPTLADLDGDGDLDAVVGNDSGEVSTFLNIGSSTAPSFIDAGTANPLSDVHVPSSAAPTLADVDGDGDLDAIIGADYGYYGIGVLFFFRNTGTTATPAFVEVTGSASPFALSTIGLLSATAFADLDHDGDLDLVGGESYGKLFYYINTGSSSVPAFSRITGTANPFAGLDVGDVSAPVIADLDGDGDLNILIGESGGALSFLRSGVPIFVDGFESGDTSAWSQTVP